MKLVVIGVGQCGGRIADEFARLNKRARIGRGIEIVTSVHAINTDTADLSGLRTIKTDYEHRIIVGGGKTGGHGVGKINEIGAEIVKEDADKVIDAIRSAPRFAESDAFLLIAGAAGGTGSGGIAALTQRIRDRHVDKPVYNLIVLPFEHEERTEERTIYNTATCLKSVDSVADAIFLVDNQRYVRKDFSLINNITKINSFIAEPFYNLLCSGEEKKAKHIGARLLDAGDIMQTVVGWTLVGYGQSSLPMIRLPFKKAWNFRNKSDEIYKGIQAMEGALSELSAMCNPADAGRALYLLSAPAKEMNMDLVKTLGDRFKEFAPNAVIRNGDYPRGGGVDVTVILSELADVEKVRKYYRQSASLMREGPKKHDEAESKLSGMQDAAQDVPSL